MSSLHAGVVEIYVKRGAKCKYSTIQNWSKDVYNLVTKRAIVEENGVMDWVDGNVGSGVTMKYPSCILLGDNAVGNSISIAYAKENDLSLILVDQNNEIWTSEGVDFRTAK